ncbi:MAG: NAD(P)/FAD-dependent oxidoreductase [Clostridiales bacterium]|jgi:NADH dehydrogenase|nr:NAD(P)/FAD-dependent oxidoreductase [Clostridiales bacterium]
MEKKRIVIAGAGYAGVLTAKKLAKRVKKQKLSAQVEITIIDKNPFHTMLTELHEVAAQRVEEDSIKISLAKVFAGRDVNVVTDTIKSADYDKRRIVCENSVFDYDYLVLAAGCQPIYFGTTGARENSFTLWSYDDAVILRDHITNMFRKACAETDTAKKRALLTFAVVGSGFTGVEMAGELAELVPFLCERFEIAPEYVKVINTDMLEKVCAALPDKLSEKVRRRLEKMGVEVMLGAGTTSIGKDFMEYKKDGKVSKIPTHTVIWTAGVESAEITKEASPKIGEAPRGRIQTDEFLRSKNYKNVYVGGDNIFFKPEGEETAVPQMVENAENSADTIAHNLLCDIKGAGETEKYAPKFHGTMVCVGGRYGVAHVGLPGKFFGLPSFLAMFAKHFINVIYFIQVLGWNKVFSYLRHEFFTIRNNRSFLGGHFSNRSPSFMLVPLRIYLGCYWLYEGIMKILEGWFKTPSLTGFFNGANQFYENIINSGASAAVDAAASATTEAVASATGEAAVSAGNLIFDINIFNLIRFIFVESGEYAFKMQVGLVDIFMNNVVLPSNEIQMFFQITIVLAEVLIGLALIGGLFTTPAAAVSLLLQGMFLTSTGLYMSTWWMMFAGIAMLFGGGRALALDYYVMPYLKKKWRSLRFVRKVYLYND